MWYEFLAFQQPAWLCFVVVLCFISAVLGGGSTGQWWGGGPFLWFLMVSSSGFPARGHFDNLGLGLGSPGLFICL